jgi:hypothetical protein
MNSRRIFGEDPITLHALAVMVDTDNTDSRATAWFSAITLGHTQQSPVISHRSSAER